MRRPCSASALLLRHLRQSEQALACLERCAALVPERMTVIQQRGEVKFERGDLASALEDFDAVLRTEPRQAQALLYRGVTLSQLERPAEALTAMDLALVEAPGRAEIHFNRGVLLEKFRPRSEEALAAYDRTLKPLAGPCRCLEQSRQPAAQSGPAGGGGEKLSPAPSPWFRTMSPPAPTRGTVLWMLNRNAEALADFRHLMEIAPADRTVLGGILSAALPLCDWGDGRKVCGRALENWRRRTAAPSSRRCRWCC